MAEAVENDAALEADETTEIETPEAEDASSAFAQEATPENMDDNGEAGASGEETAAASTRAPDAEGFTSALPSLSAEETEARQHVAGGVGYEIIYVVKAGDPQLVEASSQRVRELIEKSEGAIDNVRASEVRRFAYPIKKQTEGVYVVVNARFKPEFTSELDRFFKIDESILRHMMLKEDR